MKLFKTTFFFNGELYEFKTYQFLTINDLTNFFSYKKNLVVIECNVKICTPSKWPLLRLKNNDRVEIITIVGGG